MAEPTFTVLLNHLSSDAKAVGVEYGHEQQQGLSAVRLRGLLQALADAAARFTIYEPATPEIRIKTERSAFAVRTRHRRLHVLGWEQRFRGEEISVGFIMNVVTGLVPAPEPMPTAADRGGSQSPLAGAGGRSGSHPPQGGGTRTPFPSSSLTRAPFGRGSQPATGRTSRPPMGSAHPLTASTATRTPFGSAKRKEKRRGWPRWVKITVLAVLIVGLNSFTAWQIFYRPTAALVPKTQPLAEFEFTALLAKVAGEYETGGAEGDRRLIIDLRGNLRVAKYGRERVILQETTRTAKGGTLDGRAVLVTSDPATIEIKDADTVVYFNTTFRRRGR